MRLRTSIAVMSCLWGMAATGQVLQGDVEATAEEISHALESEPWVKELAVEISTEAMAVHAEERVRDAEARAGRLTGEPKGFISHPGSNGPVVEPSFQPPAELVAMLERCVAADGCSLKRLKEESARTFTALRLWCDRNARVPVVWKPGVWDVCHALGEYRERLERAREDIMKTHRALQQAEAVYLRARRARALALGHAASTDLELANADAQSADAQLRSASSDAQARAAQGRKDVAEARQALAQAQLRYAGTQLEFISEELKEAASSAKLTSLAEAQRRTRTALAQVEMSIARAKERIAVTSGAEQEKARAELAAAEESRQVTEESLKRMTEEQRALTTQRNDAARSALDLAGRLTTDQEEVARTHARVVTLAQAPATVEPTRSAGGKVGGHTTDEGDGQRKTLLERQASASHTLQRAQSAFGRATTQRDEAHHAHVASLDAVGKVDLALAKADEVDIAALGQTFSRPIVRCGGFGLLLPLVSTRKAGKNRYEVNGPVQAGIGGGYYLDMACGEDWTWGPQLFAYSEGMNPAQKLHVALAAGASVTAFKHFSFGVAAGYDLFRSAPGETSGFFSGRNHRNLSWLFTFSVVSASETPSPEAGSQGAAPGP